MIAERATHGVAFFSSPPLAGAEPMLFKSPLFSQASGSLAGTTFTHGRSGLVARARSIPTNPSTEYQQTVRSAVATLASYWGQTLTPAERDAWNSYGAGTVMTNRLGDQIYLTGQNQFIRSNVPRIQAGIAVIEAAPVVFDLGSFTPATLASLDDTPEVQIGFTDTDAWATTVGGYLLLYVSRPQSPGKGFFKGPFRYVGKITGAAVAPATPQAFAYPFALTADQKCWVQYRVIQSDGRLSTAVTLGPEYVTEAA
jgi:hypothetical protein